MAAKMIWWKNILGRTLQRSYYSSSFPNCGLNIMDCLVIHKKSQSPLQNIIFTGNKLYCSPERLTVSNSCLNQSVRGYAKSRDKKKSDKGQKKKIHINEQIVVDVINDESMKSQMENAIERLKEDYIKNLSLRSTTGSIETLPITFEGKEYILQDVAQVVRKNPKTVVINMVSFPQVIPTVLQALSKSGMNLNPQQDGTTLFIPIPKVTKEHRESLAKNAKSLFVKCRDNIKDIQNKFIKTVKNKEKDGLAKDTAQQISEYIMAVAAEHISSAEKLMEAKQQELIKDTQ